MLVLGVGHRPVHADPHDHRAEHQRLPRPRRRDLRRHVLPHARAARSAPPSSAPIYSGQLDDSAAGGASPRRRAVARATWPPRRALHSHPADVIAPVVDAYADVLHSVFLYAAPVGLRRVRARALPARRCRCATPPGPAPSDLGETASRMAENADPERALEIVIGPADGTRRPAGAARRSGSPRAPRSTAPRPGASRRCCCASGTTCPPTWTRSPRSRTCRRACCCRRSSRPRTPAT